MSQWIKNSNVATGEIFLKTLKTERVAVNYLFIDYVKGNRWPHLQAHDFPRSQSQSLYPSF